MIGTESDRQTGRIAKQEYIDRLEDKVFGITDLDTMVAMFKKAGIHVTKHELPLDRGSWLEVDDCPTDGDDNLEIYFDSDGMLTSIA